MISLINFKHATRERQQEEIRHISSMLELSERAYEAVPQQTMRGQIWKLEKYLILYLYLSKD